MSQISIDFEAPTAHVARQLGAIGMGRASEHADRVMPGFSENAFAYLKAWVSWRAVGDPFAGEEVVANARDDGIAPPDGRAWGSVFTRASRAGLIRRSATLFPRTKGHGTKSPGWERAR